MATALRDAVDFGTENTTPIAAEESRSLSDLSETVLGMMALGWIDKVAIDPTHFSEPYNRGAKELCKPGATKDDLVKVLSSDMLSVMYNKVEHMNGSRSAYDWVTMLNKAYESYILGDTLERTGYLLKQNKPIDLAPVHQRTADFMTRGITGIRRASEVDYKNYQPFMPSGNEYIDKIVGGIPTDGPIVVFGDTGAGKSHFGAKLVADFLAYHEGKTAAIYTFEMNERHYLKREIEMFPVLGKKSILDRLYVSGSIDKPSDLVPEVASHNFDFVVVDDMDNMVEGEASPGKYAAVFKLIIRIARLKSIPVVALSQAKGRGEKAKKFLTKFDAAWSAASENSAAMLIALQNAGGLDKGWEGDNAFPTTDEQMQYIIFWKSRDDWPLQRGPGAIITQMDMDSNNKFRHKIWSGPLYNNEWKLWQPARTGGK